ncbi:hypothetical protein [Nocardia stercoris]|uniref:EcsC family protein n=1 Tax=Nocardia stercoris TaxID=2483361 RepID=A0A3M2KZT3_9NOCA|nr:hypothetical protein [Nocardia stercoris]RMI30932.1 hypothetical protein EBN03_20095 [Nocardia stercoris]
MFERAVAHTMEFVVRRGTGVRDPLAARYLERLRRKHPDRSPAEIERGLETRYLVAVTAGGAVAGLVAAVPGVGTILGFAVAGLESVLFLETSALYATALGQLHDVEPLPPGDKRLLLSQVVFGIGGAELMYGQSAAHAAKDWAAKVGDRVPGIRSIENPLLKQYAVRFLVRRGLLLFGSALPAGIGAVIGATGNHALGRAVVTNARDTFGPAPAYWDEPRASSAR